MIAQNPSWKPNMDMPGGKGAIVLQFVASVGHDRLVIDIAPWGEGKLRVNGRELVRVCERRGRGEALRDLKKVAARYLRSRRPIVPHVAA